MDRERYRFQRYISDIAGQDIKEHNSDPATLIKHIRNTLNTAKINGPIEGATTIISSYTLFQSKLPDLRKELSLNQDDVTYADKTQLIEQWLKVVS